MMDYSKRIRELREKACLTQDKLAEIMGLETPNFISQIETGRKRVGLSVITKLCNALGMEISEFFRENQGNSIVSETIPLIDIAIARVDRLYDSNFRLSGESTLRIDRPLDIHDKYAYGAIVNGESMAPALREKDVVVVSPSQLFRDDDIAIVGLKSHEVLIRRVRKSNGMLLLESCNPAVETRILRLDDILFVHPVLWVRYKMPLALLPRC